jgi:hypothetical protein
MRSIGDASIICGVATEDDETHLTLRIDLGADPITGSLGSPDTASRRFSGWIGLAAALEAIRAELAREPDPCSCEKRL